MTSTVCRNRTQRLARVCGILMSVLFLCVPWPVLAQGFGTWFEGRGIDIGAYNRLVHREFGGESKVHETDWGTGGVFIRVSLAGRLGFLLGGYTWEPRATDEFPDRRYRDVSVGAAFSTYPLVGYRDRIGVTLSYSQNIMFDESRDRYHKRVDSLMLAVHYERVGHVWGQRIAAWAAPAYVADSYDNHHYGGDAVTSRSRHDLGFVLGGNIAIAGHIKPYVQALYADFWAPEFGISYQF